MNIPIAVIALVVIVIGVVEASIIHYHARQREKLDRKRKYFFTCRFVVFAEASDKKNISGNIIMALQHQGVDVQRMPAMQVAYMSFSDWKNNISLDPDSILIVAKAWVGETTEDRSIQGECVHYMNVPVYGTECTLYARASPKKEILELGTCTIRDRQLPCDIVHSIVELLPEASA